MALLLGINAHKVATTNSIQASQQTPNDNSNLITEKDSPSYLTDKKLFTHVKPKFKKKVVQEKIPKKINCILINDELDLIPLSGKIYQSPLESIFSSKSLTEMKYNSNQSNNATTTNPSVNSAVLKTIDLNANMKQQLNKEKSQTIEEFYRFSTELDIKSIQDFESRNSDYPDEKYLHTNNNNQENVQLRRNGSNNSNRKLSIDHFKFISSRLSNRNNVANQSGSNTTNTGSNKPQIISGQNLNEQSSATNQLKYTVLRNKVFNINESAECLLEPVDSNGSSIQPQQNASSTNSVNANSNKLTYLKRYVANSLTSKFTDGNWNRIPGSKLKASNPNRAPNMNSLVNINLSQKINANHFQSNLNINSSTPSNITNVTHSSTNDLVNHSLNNPNGQSTKSNLINMPSSAYLNTSNRELTIIDLQLPIKQAAVSQSTNGGTQLQPHNNHHLHHSFLNSKQHRVNLISAKNSFNYDYCEPNQESVKSINNGGTANKSPSKILITTVIKPHITSMMDVSNNDSSQILASNTYDIAFNSSNENHLENIHSKASQQHQRQQLNRAGEFTSNYVNKNLNYFKYVMHQQKKRQINSTSELNLNGAGQQAVGLTSNSLNANNNPINGSGLKKHIQIHQQILPLHTNMVNNTLTSNTLLIKRLK